MRISFYDIPDWEADYIKSKLLGHDLVFKHEPLSAETADASSAIVSVFMTSSIGQAVLDVLPQLQYIATRSTGYDHINLAAVAKRNIVVSNVPTYGSETVAEFTFALLLALSRKLYPAL